MSNFQNPYQKISWLERRLNALESMVRKVVTPGGVVSGGTSGGPTQLGVPLEHDHTGTSSGGKLTGDVHDSFSEYDEIAAPATPAANKTRIYVKADGNVYQKTDAGVETNLAAGGGGSVATDTIWDSPGDLAVGTGADTAAKLAISVPAANIVNVPGVINGETTYSVKSLMDATVATTQAFGDAAAAGTGVLLARITHKHAMPADPVTAHVAAGDPHTGYVQEADANWIDLTDGGATTLHTHAGGTYSYGKTIATAAGGLLI